MANYTSVQLERIVAGYPNSFSQAEKMLAEDILAARAEVEELRRFLKPVRRFHNVVVLASHQLRKELEEAGFTPVEPREQGES